MIDRREIMDCARDLNLRVNVIEKDYILSWILAGITHHYGIKSNWIFKGGTCLKKCYFETYRFSEDLDFTIINEEHLEVESLMDAFRNIADWIYDAAGIEIPGNLISFEKYKNPGGHISIQGKIPYHGPMQFRGEPPRVKLDLTESELLVLPPVIRDICHPYSDKPETGFQVQSYPYEELFAEKLRALGERLRPRDLYDVVHLYQFKGEKPDQMLILETLQKKCDFKEIPVPTFTILETHPERQELESEWMNMLGHQLMNLPPWKQYWETLPEIFSWLNPDIS